MTPGVRRIIQEFFYLAVGGGFLPWALIYVVQGFVCLSNGSVTIACAYMGQHFTTIASPETLGLMGLSFTGFRTFVGVVNAKIYAFTDPGNE